MIQCSKCLNSLPASGFYRTGKYLRSYCKTCEYKAKSSKRLEKKLRAVDLLGGKCVACGYNKCHYALDLDHIDPATKSLKPASMFQGLIWSKIEPELKKCQLLCANCHREKTFAKFLE